MGKTFFSKTDLRAHFGVSREKLEQMLADGILSAPHNKNAKPRFSQGKMRQPRLEWTIRQVREAERRIMELKAPPELQTDFSTVSRRPIRKLNTNQERQLAEYKQ